MKLPPFIFIICCFVIVSGCIGANSNIDPQPGYVDGHNLEFYDGDQFIVNGSLALKMDGASPHFNDVMICLYTSDGEVLDSENIGTLTGPNDRQNISATTEERPRYVVVDHSEFHDYDTFSPLVVEWTDEYVRHETSPSEDIETFQYSPPVETGECGGSV